VATTSADTSADKTAGSGNAAKRLAGIELLCRKIGMTRIYNEAGQVVPVTVLEAGPNAIVQKKTAARDGYDALQLGFGERKRTRTPKPLLGHFDKAEVSPKRHLHESRVTAEDATKWDVGQELKADVFEAGQRIDVIGTSKGRGMAGVVKRHHFAVKKESHGTHEGFRNPGSIGAGTYPGHVIKGQRMPGHLGNEQVTTRNLVVARVDAERNLLLVRGSVPGPNDGIVRVRAAIAARS
jgi:large subunit ribosomal protein L3